MKKFWKWVGIVLGVLAGLVVIFMVVVYFKTQARLTRVHDLPEEMVAIPLGPDRPGDHQRHGCRPRPAVHLIH